MPDYSEFPTTPTAWQEQVLRDQGLPDQAWQEVAPLEVEDPPHAQRPPVDPTALVPGLLFVVLALGSLAGGHLPATLIGGGLVWVLLVGAGLALLAGELRRARHRR